MMQRLHFTTLQIIKAPKFFSVLPNQIVQPRHISRTVPGRITEWFEHDVLYRVQRRHIVLLRQIPSVDGQSAEIKDQRLRIRKMAISVKNLSPLFGCYNLVSISHGKRREGTNSASRLRRSKMNDWPETERVVALHVGSGIDEMLAHASHQTVEGALERTLFISDDISNRVTVSHLMSLIIIQQTIRP